MSSSSRGSRKGAKRQKNNHGGDKPGPTVADKQTVRYNPQGAQRGGRR